MSSATAGTPRACRSSFAIDHPGYIVSAALYAATKLGIPDFLPGKAAGH